MMINNLKTWLLALCGLCSWPVMADAPCELLLLQSQLQPATVNGQPVYVIARADVDERLQQTGCISYSQLLKDNDAALADVEKLLQAQQALTEKLTQQLDRYHQLVSDSSNLNNRYSDLSDRYGSQLSQYEQLTGDLTGVAHNFDRLAGEYRSIARSLLRERRIGAAVGNDVYMLQGGYRYLNLFYLNQDGDDKVLIGAEMNF